MKSFLPGGFPIIDPVTHLERDAAPEISEIRARVADHLMKRFAGCFELKRDIPVVNGVSYPEYATLSLVVRPPPKTE